jgi:glucose-6-phosphate isomerase
VATIDAYSLGALFFLFEMVIPLMGKLYEVNAFDQPGVEQGKIYTKALMGKEGYEEERRRVEDLLAAPREIVSF